MEKEPPSLRDLDIAQAKLDGCAWAARQLRSALLPLLQLGILAKPVYYHLRDLAEYIEKGPDGDASTRAADNV